MSLTIKLPDGKTFTGPGHTAGTDGSLMTSYRTSSSDPAGTYQVTVHGPDGRQGMGQFDATGGPGTTAKLAGSTTTKSTTRSTTNGPTTTRSTTTTVRR